MNRLLFILVVISFIGCYNKDFNTTFAEKGKNKTLTFNASDSVPQYLRFYVSDDGYLSRADRNNSWYKISYMLDSVNYEFNNNLIPFKGEQYITLKITTNNNETEDARNETINIQTNNNNVSSCFYIRQNPLVGEINLFPFIDQDTAYKYSFKTNLDWTASSNNSDFEIKNVNNGVKNDTSKLIILYPTKTLTKKIGYITITVGKEISKILIISNKYKYDDDQFDTIRFAIGDETTAKLDSIKPYGDNHLIYRLYFSVKTENPSFYLKEISSLAENDVDVVTEIENITSNNNAVNIIDHKLQLTATTGSSFSFYLIDNDGSFSIEPVSTSPFSARAVIRGVTSLNVRKGNSAKIECFIQCSDSNQEESLSYQWQYMGDDGKWNNLLNGTFNEITIASDLIEKKYSYRCIVAGEYESNVLKINTINQ